MASILHSDTARCFGLILTSLLLAPISIAVSLILLSKNILINKRHAPEARQITSTKRPSGCTTSRHTVLVTGVGMAKGLTLARAFHLCGHRVIGADVESDFIPCSGRFSRSLSAFRRLPKPKAGKSSANSDLYIKTLIQTIKSEGIELWVSCSGVASAIEDAQAKEAIEAQTSCRCIQFDVATTALLHEKSTFMRVCTERGLRVPETFEVTSTKDILQALATAGKTHAERKFILKPIGVDDANRGNMTLLPLSSVGATENHVSRLPVTQSTPWILQQYVRGSQEYCTHALVVRGEVRCFVACPSSEMLMHYKALPRDSALWRAMLDFTLKFLQGSPNREQMTGHLSFDFMLDQKNGEPDISDVEGRLYSIECNPRAHTAVVLFGQESSALREMVEAYLSVLGNHKSDKDLVGISKRMVVPPADCLSRYWLGHDLVSFLSSSLMENRLTSRNHAKRATSLLDHIISWKEGTFEDWDPWPALVLYHVFYPLTILSAWWHGQRWSRINVSTTKMFAC